MRIVSPVDDERARQTDEIERIARRELRRHEVDDVTAMRPDVIAHESATPSSRVLRREDERVVTSVAERRVSVCRSSASSRSSGIAKVLHSSREQWWMHARDVWQCLTFAVISSHVTDTRANARRFYP